MYDVWPLRWELLKGGVLNHRDHCTYMYTVVPLLVATHQRPPCGNKFLRLLLCMHLIFPLTKATSLMWPQFPGK